MQDSSSNTAPPTTAAITLPQGRFEGRAAFQQWIRDALSVAARDGWREITVSDADFHDWPLGERAVCDALTAWSRSGRRFVMLACRYEVLIRQHARFVAWRQAFSHLIDCKACAHAEPLELPSALYSPHWALRRLDPMHCIGYGGVEAARRVQVREAQSEWLSKSTPAFPASVLGL